MAIALTGDHRMPMAMTYIEKLLDGLIDTFDFPKNVGMPPNADRFYETFRHQPVSAVDLEEITLKFATGLPENYEFLPYTLSVGTIPELGPFAFCLSIIGRKKE